MRPSIAVLNWQVSTLPGVVQVANLFVAQYTNFQILAYKETSK